VKKNMHLVLNSSTGTLVTVAISTAPDERIPPQESVLAGEICPHSSLHGEGGQGAHGEEAAGGHPILHPSV